MKRLLFIIVVSMIYAECTNPTASTTATAANDTSSANFPFKPVYSSKFSIGKESNALNVLNSYKAWQDGDMEAFKTYLGDSLTIYFNDGGKYHWGRDSAVYYAKDYRDSLSKVEYQFDAWMPLHADDKDEDIVVVWYKEINTHKDGKIDSAYFQEDNILDKNGKIVFVDSHKRELK